MADTTTRKLRLKFISSTGATVYQNWSQVKAPNAIARSSVRNLMSTIITNKEIFDKKPVEIRAADVITTTKTSFEVE